ncbi:MAG: Nif3-like dinuclear metal center hexameric protein [Rikenellaceae bacterium]
MKVKDITAAIEEFAPKTLAESWDNVGLMVGATESDIQSVLLTLDVTERVVDEAIERNIGMIISHHPLIFSPLKSITGATDAERAIVKAIKNNIAIYSAHTNADSAHGGVSQILAEKLGVKITAAMEQNPSFEIHIGLGVIGELDEPTNTLEFLAKVKSVLNLPIVKHSEPHTQMVQKIAICGGSGASFIEKAKQLGADLYLTGDLKYHDYFAPEGGITIADIGHYESEIAILEKFEKVLKSSHTLKGLEICHLKECANPIKTL